MTDQEKWLSVGRVTDQEKWLSVGRVTDQDKWLSVGRVTDQDKWLSVGRVTDQDKWLSVSRVCTIQCLLGLSPVWYLGSLSTREGLMSAAACIPSSQAPCNPPPPAPILILIENRQTSHNKIRIQAEINPLLLIVACT